MNKNLPQIPALSPADIEFLALSGISTENALSQAEQITIGFPFVKLNGACQVGQGILQLSETQKAYYQSIYKNQPKNWCKFVPASGASSRMFQAWLNCVQDPVTQATELEKWNLQKYSYAFTQNPPQYPGFAKVMNKPSTMDGVDGLRYLMQDCAFAKLPKAAIPFHRYSDHTRTPLDEHSAEAFHSQLALHFTVSPEHESLFKLLISGAKNLGFDVPTTYSFQAAETQSLALNPAGEWIRDEQGNLLLRPSGHGALLQNVANSPTPWVFIRNIDNVVPEGDSHKEAHAWREAMAGVLIEKWTQIQAYKKEVSDQTLSDTRKSEILEDLVKTFSWSGQIPSIQDLGSILKRPIRVCGVVKNTGEPGGGPFFTMDSFGQIRPQIVESAQVDLSDPSQSEIFRNATHFNPVDLLCALADENDQRYDLSQFMDPNTGFKVCKSYMGEALYALEKPGLWNGSMAYWFTIFVEIPSICFAPVKTVHDLLRPEHLNT